MRSTLVKIVATSGALAAALVAGAGAANAAPGHPQVRGVPCAKSAVAPSAMNPIPADDGCPTTGLAPATRALVNAPTAALATPATTISESPKAFDTTNGDILAISKVNGAATAELAFGGNFSAVITPDGVSHKATNFAVVDETTGAIRYAGSANSYVRAIASSGGTIYAGGDFTSFGGVSRSHIAALSPSFAVTSFNPVSPAAVRAVAVDGSGVYFGGDNSNVRKVTTGTGAAIWSQSISGGGIKAMQLTPDGGSIFIGGLFEVYGGLVRHGLVKASTSSGVPNVVFNANFRPDSNVGADGSFDGEEGISFALTPEGTNLIVGIGGHGADETRKVNITTGALVWNRNIIGDCQAVVQVGDSYVVGYHRNQVNGSVPYPYFSAQLDGTTAGLTSWNPELTGNQSNADGGNNGVQAAYADPATKTLFIAGAFTTYNGVAGHKSLIAFTFS
jgi:hypothetical protein